MRDWQESLRKEKLICDALRKCEASDSSSIIRADGWCPREDFVILQESLQDAVRQAGAQEPVIQVSFH